MDEKTPCNGICPKGSWNCHGECKLFSQPCFQQEYGFGNVLYRELPDPAYDGTLPAGEEFAFSVRFHGEGPSIAKFELRLDGTTLLEIR